MSYLSRMDRAFEHAPCLTLDQDSKYILFSDCHRGVGNAGDNFLKNQNIYFAALKHYYESGYHYIELGDGDELWENRGIHTIMDIHSNVFWLMSKFYEEKRLDILYGNHDIQKKRKHYNKNVSSLQYTYREPTKPLLPGIRFHSGLLLKNPEQDLTLYLTHGHQVDFFNSVVWPIACFMVRHVWKPLEMLGFLAPISAGANTTKRHKSDQRLIHWSKTRGKTLIAGHTHRPRLLEEEYPLYINTGSCIHPRCITGVEIENMQFTLVKWTYNTREDLSLYVSREVLAGPVPIHSIL